MIIKQNKDKLKSGNGKLEKYLEMTDFHIFGYAMMIEAKEKIEKVSMKYSSSL